MEKELSIDIAELRRDFRTITSEIQLTLEAFENNGTKDMSKSSDPATTVKSDTENNISVNRNSSRHRKKSILNEASYLAHRLSRALSHSGLSDNEETNEAIIADGPQETGNHQDIFVFIHMLLIIKKTFLI